MDRGSAIFVDLKLLEASVSYFEQVYRNYNQTFPEIAGIITRYYDSVCSDPELSVYPECPYIDNQVFRNNFN